MQAVTHEQIPKFEAPSPTKSQEAAMRIAGRLLTAGDPKNPNVTLHALVTEVGGFEQLGDNANAGQNPNNYRHSAAETYLVTLKQDETTNRSHAAERRPNSSSDLDDINGTTSLDGAVIRTLNGNRIRPERLTFKQKVALQLARYATKSVGHYPYIKHSK